MPFKDPEKQKEYHRNYHKEYYKKNKEKVLAKNREWKDNNREKILEQGKKYSKKYKTRPEIIEREKEYRKVYGPKYYQDNIEKLTKYHKEYYEANRDELLAKDKIYRNKPEIKERTRQYKKSYREDNQDKIKAYRKDNKDKINKYQIAHRSIKINNSHNRHNPQTALDERSIIPKPQDMEWMEDVVTIYCFKFKKVKEEVLSDAYMGLLYGLRTWDRIYDKEKAIKVSIWNYLRRTHTKTAPQYVRKKLDVQEYSLNKKIDIDGVEGSETVDLLPSSDYTDKQADNVIDAEYFKKEIKKRFKKTNNTKYSNLFYYNFWYDKNINNLSNIDMIKKLGLTKSQVNNLHDRVSAMFKNIKDQIIRDNPSWR